MTSVMTTEILIKSIPLENNLLISFYDGSRKIAGDRWQIIVTARINVAVDQVQFTRTDMNEVSEITKKIGDNVVFEKQLIRNFIDETQKEVMIKSLYESFLHNTMSYISHRQFAEKFILKTYADTLEKCKWVKN